MQILIPIKQLKSDSCEANDVGSGVWDHLTQLGDFPALEYWGRQEPAALELHHPSIYSTIPPDVQHRHGVMHLDYWLAPQELIDVPAAADIGLIGRPVGLERKPIFEVKLNVGDYKAEELRVSLGEDRLLTIEGRHEEHEDDDDEGYHYSRHLDTLYATCKRSVTLPKSAFQL